MPPSTTPGQTPALATDLFRIHTIEACAWHALPAPQSERHGDWILRLAGGYTKRANSANAAVPHASFDGVQEAAQALYARHGLPAVFRVTPLAEPEADAQLQAAGYTVFDPSRVMVRALDGPLPPSAGPVEITAQPTPAWLAGLAAANGVAAQHQPIHHAMVNAIALPAAFATLRHAGEAIGFGLAVREGDAVGFYDIVIAPAHRRRGHAAVLMHALMDWAREDGVHNQAPVGPRWAYLQVRDQNPAARQLYAGLGFQDFYRYHYRVPAEG